MGSVMCVDAIYIFGHHELNFCNAFNAVVSY